MTFLSELTSFFKFCGNFVRGSTLATLYWLKAVLLFFVPKCLRYKDVSLDIALITGGASGIGRLMAINLAKRGAQVVIWDINPQGLEETAKMIEELRSQKKYHVGMCHRYVVNISDRQSVYSAAERVKQEVGNVTIIINNAGVVTGKRLLECSDQNIIKTFDVNILAHFWILKAFLPSMMENNHGHIVTIASIAGLVGAYQLTDYCASKFAAGMFAGIGRSMIPILKPEYVANETIKAMLVNQEMLCLPSTVYFLSALKHMMPAKSFDWAHRATGGAGTMKTFEGRKASQFALLSKHCDNGIGLDMAHIGITIPDIHAGKLRLNQ